jgi:hypothetical protein
MKLLFFPLVHKPRTAGEHDRADDFLQTNKGRSGKACAWSNMMVRTPATASANGGCQTIAHIG